MNSLMGVAKLMRLASEGITLQDLVNRAAQNPDPADMLMGLSFVFQLFGKRENALDMQEKALQFRRLFLLPAEKPKIRLLVLMQEGDMQDNTPVDFLLENADVDLLLYYSSTSFPVPESIPEHDLLFVAIGESSSSRELLEKIGVCLKEWPKRVLNSPENIPLLSRSALPPLLSSIDDLIVPKTARKARADLASNKYPFIARPLDAHAGRDLEKFDRAEDVERYLSRVEGELFYASEYVDYKSRDGLYRKYRIAVVEGLPYPCHMAISDHWMVSYRNAGMEKSSEKRAMEAEFMSLFSFGKRHEKALKAITEIVGLDYFVIDCGEHEGQLLLFEIDNRAYVHDMDSADLYPYKGPALRRLFDAFRNMLDH
jgi:glutathione synthase/RimK-type ligase-like ATP-grasp enzyme